MDIIKEGDYVLFQMASDNKKICKVTPNGTLMFGKFGRCTSSELIGLHYDVTYELDRGRITIADTEALLESFALETGDDQSGNNQNINDTKDAQKLTMAEIEAMKEAESSSADIIRAIVRNSSTYDEKSDFAKAKFIKRKAKKFSKLITPMRPTSHNLTIFFNEKLPAKIMDLRFDTLSQLLHASAVSPTSGPVLVMDETQGLIIGALLERMNGAGKLVGLHERDVGNYEIIKEMNFTPEQLSCLTTFPWNRLDTEIVLDLSIPPGSQEKVEERLSRRKVRFDELSEAKAIIDNASFHTFVLATSFAVLPILKKVMPYLAGSASIVIYSPDKESLIDTFNYMRASKELINVQLTESWVREYQLPLQKMSGTHPHMNALPHGGFLLCAIRVFGGEDLVLNMSFREAKMKKRAKLENAKEKEEKADEVAR